MKRILSAGVVSLLLITSGVIVWAENNFDNPTGQTQTPIGYWRVSDIKKLFDGQQKGSDASEIKIWGVNNNWVYLRIARLGVDCND